MPELNIYSGGRWVAVSGGTGGDSAITVHDGPLPQPASPLPSEIENAFSAYEDGLHYFKGSGAIVSIKRQPLQTAVVVDGPVRSVSRVSRSDAGLPTPENPCTVLSCGPDGKWIKVSSDSPSTPFGPPEIIDLFELPAQISQFVTDAIAAINIPSLDDVYTKTESDRKFLDQQYFLDNAYYGPGIVFKDTNGSIRWKTPNLGDGTGPAAVLSTSLWTSSPSLPAVPRLYFESNDEAGGYLAYSDEHYTKKEVDDKLGADKDFSIANDNNILAGLTALQDVVTNLGTVGTGQIDVLGAIKGAAVEPSKIVFPEAQLSPIQWKGGLALAPLKDGTEWRLGWNDGKSVQQVLTPADLSTYAKKNDNTQTIAAKQVIANTLTMPGCGFVYRDLNDGYGTRLYCVTATGPVEFDGVILKSDLEEILTPLLPRVEALESKQALAAAVDPSVYTDAIAESVQKIDLLGMEVGLSASATKNTADKVQELEARINAINPTGTVDINDPSLADFKKSVLDEVKKMMAGGKTIPADVPWTKLLNAGNAANAPEAKVLNGIVYMRGEAVKQGGAGYTANAYQLPPTIPAPPREMVVPLAMKNTTPAGRYYGYATIQTNRQIGVSCDNPFNTVWFDGISYPAYE